MPQQQQTESALGKIPRSKSRVLGQLLEKVRPNIQERERSKSTGQVDKPLTTPQKPVPKKPFTSRFVIDTLLFKELSYKYYESVGFKFTVKFVSARNKLTLKN